MYFASIQDFVTTVLKINVLTFGGSIATALIGFITGYVYHDFYVVCTLVCVFGLDLLTGIYASYIRKADEEGKDEGIKTFILAIKSKKLLRSFISLSFHFMLLSIGWHVSKTQPVFGFFPSLLVGAVFTTQLVSISENLYKAKVIKGAVFDVIINRLDLTKILGKKDKPKD